MLIMNIQPAPRVCQPWLYRVLVRLLIYFYCLRQHLVYIALTKCAYFSSIFRNLISLNNFESKTVEYDKDDESLE